MIFLRGYQNVENLEALNFILLFFSKPIGSPALLNIPIWVLNQFFTREDNATIINLETCLGY